jgi:hypothetical protein
MCSDILFDKKTSSLKQIREKVTGPNYIFVLRCYKPILTLDFFRHLFAFPLKIKLA